MTIVVEFTQTKTVLEGPLYKVSNVVNYVENIQPEIFVHNTETQEFEYVATLYDMDEYPNSLQGAIDADKNYYRSPSAEKTYDTLTTAQEFEAHVYSRVGSLVQDYAQSQGDFPGEVRRIITE
jgi:hypothetical protein